MMKQLRGIKTSIKLYLLGLVIIQVVIILGIVFLLNRVNTDIILIGGYNTIYIGETIILVRMSLRILDEIQDNLYYETTLLDDSSHIIQEVIEYTLIGFQVLFIIVILLGLWFNK